METAHPGGGSNVPTRYEQLIRLICYAFNEDTLIRLERNDPDMDRLWIMADFWSPRAAQAIGRSRYLRKLSIAVGCPVKYPRYKFLHELFQGLSANRSIEMIHIAGRERGSLDIIFDLLAPFLERNQRLRIFHMMTVNLSQSMNSLCRSLQNRASKIEQLCLMDCRIEEDEVTIFCDMLMKKNRLRSLELNGLTGPSLRALLSAVSHPDCQLEELILSKCDDDDAFLNIRQSFAVNNSLLHLNLSRSSKISTQAWIACFIFLRDAFSGLEVLRLNKCYIYDEGISELIATLENNSRLRKVYGLGCYGKTVWDDCSRMLCNKTCIDSTFASNHTIHVIDIETFQPYEDEDEDEDDVVDDVLKDDVMWSLKMNENENKAEVSQIKIVKAHFSGLNADAGSSIFTRMPEPILPSALEWIGRTRVGLSLMYLVVRELPMMFDTRRGPYGERKRKIGAAMIHG